MCVLVCHGSGLFASKAFAMPVVKDPTDSRVRVIKATPGDAGLMKSLLLRQVKSCDIVAIVGGGPAGLAALLTAQSYAPSGIIMIDVDKNRLEVAKRFGATKGINNTNGRAVEKVMALTNNRGVDVAIDAIGIPLSFNVCQAIVAEGGCILNISPQGKSVPLELEKLWDRNITVTAGVAHAVTASKPLSLVIPTKARLKEQITHHFSLIDVAKAYDTFGHAMDERELRSDYREELEKAASF